MIKKPPPTASEIVELLGGRNAVAAAYHVTYNAVSNWCAWNRFPQRLHLRIFKDCQDKGTVLPDNYFEHSADSEVA